MKQLKKILFLFLFCSSVSKAQEATDILSALIKIPSVSGKEKPALLFMESMCRYKGLNVRVFSNTDSTYNFAASLFPLSDNKPNIVFLSHLDVIAIDDIKEWRKPPFSGIIEKDTLWGRGALDMKGMAVIQLMAILKLKENYDLSKLKYNVTLLCVSGEESGGINGAKIICDNFLNELKPVVVLGEGGAGLQNVIPGKPNQKVFFVSLAEKKSLWIKLEAKLRSHGHASMPSNKSANKIILRAINKVEEHDSKIKFDQTTKLAFKKLGKLVPGFKGLC